VEKYSDKSNEAGIRVIFMIAQMFVLSIVYIFVYSSFVLVSTVIEKNGVSPVMYFPVFMAFVIFPVLLYRYRGMFNRGKKLLAFAWMMGTASLTIVMLLAYITQFSN